MCAISTPVDLGKKLQSLGIERGSILKLECVTTEKICEDFIMQLFNKGYTISKDEGIYEIIIGPIKMLGGDSIALYYKIINKKDSVIFKKDNYSLDVRKEDISKNGILSSLFFIFTGYLLFFVIK